MNYISVEPSIFTMRPNRFVAECLLNGGSVSCHVKNTGRCKEILVPGARVYLEKSPSPSRKTAYSLIAAEKNGNLINIDSQAPNKAVEEALKEGFGPYFDMPAPLTFLKSEKKYKNSRFDFYAETEKDKIFIEVKGVTLEKNGVAMFPDAPTERGLKHVKELIDASGDGYLAYIIFVIQMKHVTYFTPNIQTHQAFADILKTAEKAGVKLLAYDCDVTPSSMRLSEPITVCL